MSLVADFAHAALPLFPRTKLGGLFVEVQVDAKECGVGEFVDGSAFVVEANTCCQCWWVKVLAQMTSEKGGLPFILEEWICSQAWKRRS